MEAQTHKRAPAAHSLSLARVVTVHTRDLAHAVVSPRPAVCAARRSLPRPTSLGRALSFPSVPAAQHSTAAPVRGRANSTTLGLHTRHAVSSSAWACTGAHSAHRGVKIMRILRDGRCVRRSRGHQKCRLTSSLHKVVFVRPCFAAASAVWHFMAASRRPQAAQASRRRPRPRAPHPAPPVRRAAASPPLAWPAPCWRLPT